MLVPPESSSAVLVMITSKSVSICNRSLARHNDFVGEVSLSFERNLLTRKHETWLQKTRDSALSYGENPASLSHLGLVQYRDVTDR